MADAKVGVLVTAKDEASAKLKAVKKSLDELDKGAKVAAGGVKGMTGDMGGMVAALGGLGVGVAGVAALTVAIGDLTKQGLRANALEASFESLAAGVGASSQEMLAGLRAASQGMISDSDLILSANRSMMLGVAQTTDEMASLLQVAAVRGQAMGLSVGQAFQDIVTGIGRMSPLILDNLGIVTGGEKVFDDYAASLGRAASSLTDMEKKQALVNSVMASTDTSTAVAVSGFAKLEAALTNVTDAIGKMLAASTGINAAVGGIGDFLNAQIAAEEEAVQMMARQDVGRTIQQIDALRMSILDLQDVQKLGLVMQDPDIIKQTTADLAKLSEQISKLAQDYNRAGAIAGYNPIDIPQLQKGVLSYLDPAVAKQQGAATGVAVAEGLAPELQKAIDEARGVWVNGIRQMYLEGRITSEQEVLAWMGAIDEQLNRQIADLRGQKLTDAQIGMLGLGSVVQAELANLATLGMPQAQTTGQKLAEGLRAGIESQLQGKAVDIAFSVDPSLNRAAEGAEWLDAVMQTVTHNTAFWGAEVDAGRMSVTEAVIQAELLGTTFGLAADDVARVNNEELVAASNAFLIGQNLAAGMQGALSIVNEVLGKFGAAVSAGAGFVAKTLISLPPGMDSAINEKAYQTLKKTGDLTTSLAQKDADRTAALKMWPEILTQANGDIEAGDMLWRLRTDAVNAQTAALTKMAGGGGGGGGGGGLSAVNRALDNITSKVKGVLSGAWSADIGGLNVKDFLPREDAINENARRLAAIMRDGIANQEWLPEFKLETGGLFDELIASGDVKGAAARILQEFQAGMRPELIDREMVKENVKRMILGEQSMAELADSIAMELAGEMGMSIAKAQALVGEQLGTAPGAGMQQAIGEGVDGGTQAESFVSGWVATMNRLYTRIYETGATSGTQWGAGFMATVEGGVPGALIGLLVGLVTPGVMAQMAAQQSTAGAR